MDPEATPEELDTTTTAEAEATPPDHVVLGGLRVPIALPDSYAVRAEITRAGWTNSSRAYAAALGACMRGPRKPAPGRVHRPSVAYGQCDYSPLVYGQRVLDELVGRGIPYWEIQAAGGVCWVLCSRDLVQAGEVAAKEAGFPG